MRTDWMNISINTPTITNDFKQLSDATVLSVLDGDANSYGLLEIAGIDSAKFLQGQITCNMQDITPQQSRLGAHCTHKGRMVASFRLLQTSENSYLFCLPKQTLPALQKSLGKYIVFSKAKLRDASDDYLQLGISGLKAAQKIIAVFGKAPTSAQEQHQHENGIVICIDKNSSRFLCIIPAAQAKTVFDALSTDTTITDCHYWHWLNIRDGLGDIRAETIEEFIPQMLNLQLTDGISFTKGCYTGQEIVARMQYRGTLKKSAYRIAGKGVSPKPATPLFQENASQASGQIVIAEAVGDDQWEALAVIQHDALTHPLHTTNSACITLLTLPYIDQDPQ